MHPNALVAGDADRALDPGLPRPVLMACRHGHSERIDHALEVETPATVRGIPRCAVCGVEIPREKGAAPRKSCGPTHRRFIAHKRAEAYKAFRRQTPGATFHFVVEEQPWYRGAVVAFRPAPPPAEVVMPTWAEFPEIPAGWLEGFRRLYPVLEPAASPLAIFPPLEDAEEGDALLFTTRTRKYRRRRPRRELTPEQLMPSPVREA